jgi:hypothetical protein
MAIRYFVFVEFTDPMVSEALQQLRSTIAGHPMRDTPHVTVRGPYSKPPDPVYVQELSDRLHGQGVLIADVGYFETPKGYAVFLHAKSKLFDEVWWKPDFSGPRTRRIPHVTIYETASRGKAMAVLDFLKSEKIEIVTYGVELTVYTSKQQTLLPRETRLPNIHVRRPQERFHFREGIVERAEKLAIYLDGYDKEGSGQQLLL